MNISAIQETTMLSVGTNIMSWFSRIIYVHFKFINFFKRCFFQCIVFLKTSATHILYSYLKKKITDLCCNITPTTHGKEKNQSRDLYITKHRLHHEFISVASVIYLIILIMSGRQCGAMKRGRRNVILQMVII